MKKFILEVLFIVTLIISTGFLLYKVESGSTLADKVNSIAYPLDIINLGTSHGNDFDYRECTKLGMSINKEGNTLYYDLQNFIYLDKKKKLSDNAVIIIPVSYFVFGLGENREDRLPDNSFVNDYYYYLPKEQIFNYSDTKRDGLIMFRIQNNANNIFSKKTKSNNSIEKSNEDLKKHALPRAIHHKKIGRFRSPNTNIHYLSDIIEKSKSKGYRPILVCTPYYHYYNEFMGEDWLRENYFVVMDSLSKMHDIEFLDYSHDERFSYNNIFFANSDHLNAKGKALFSQIIFDEIYKK